MHTQIYVFFLLIVVVSTQTNLNTLPFSFQENTYPLLFFFLSLVLRQLALWTREMRSSSMRPWIVLAGDEPLSLWPTGISVHLMLTMY